MSAADAPLAPKVLVAGSVNGRFREFFDKLGAVNAKNGPFACCFCVGAFFAPAAAHSAATLCAYDAFHDSSLAALRDGTIKGLHQQQKQSVFKQPIHRSGCWLLW